MKDHPMKTRVEKLLHRLRAVPCPPDGCICDLLNEAADCIEAMDKAGQQLGKENNALKEAVGMAGAAVCLMLDDCNDRPAN